MRWLAQSARCGGLYMNVVAVMPIKMNNERCPGKNTRTLGNKPLLQYELDSLIETNLCNRIIVYCSTEKITDYLPDGVEFMLRSEKLDLPSANFSQIFSSFFEKVNADIYVYAHATAPFVKVDTMIECIEAVKSGEYDSAFCAERIQDFVWMNGKPINFTPEDIPRTQDLCPVYRETSGVYVFEKAVFEKLHRRVGEKPFIKEVSFEERVDIDEPEDFVLAERLVDTGFVFR